MFILTSERTLHILTLVSITVHLKYLLRSVLCDLGRSLPVEKETEIKKFIKFKIVHPNTS